MKPITIENLRLHPEVLAVLHARARKARAEVMRNFFARLLNKVAPNVDLRFRPVHWG